MSFLNPSVLLALTAISIPVIIHLLNLRKLKKVEFSTLMFLKEIQKSKMRKIKLRQLLLLLFRVLVIGFLVLSFARPVFDGFAGNSISTAKSSALIFIDDSFSMNSRDSQGQYLTQSVEMVKKILAAHKESDNIYFIPFSRIGLKEPKILYDNKNEIYDSLKNLKSSDKYTSVNDVLNISDEILADSKDPVKEIYIISDFQKNNFSGLNNQLSSNLNYKTINKDYVNTFLVNIGSREVNNISLDSFEVVSGILEKNKEIKLKINLNNYSKSSVKNKTVNLYTGNELKGEKVADIDSYSKKEIEFKFKPDKTGFINGYLELIQSEFAEDELIQDNKYYFDLYIPEKFDITFIEDNSIDFNYLELVIKSSLSLLSDSANKQSDFFNIKREKNINENVFKSDVVFISNKKSFSENEVDILKEYVSNGGGVFIFLGADVDINNYNSVLLNKLNSVRISKLNSDKEVNSGLKFEKIDFENPLMSEIFKNQNLNITSEKYIVESPDIYSYYELLPNENIKPVITLNNNKLFLAESDLAKGKVIIASVSAANDLSDLPLKTIFLPLVIRSLYYLGNNFDYQKEYVTGQNNLIAVRGLKNFSAITLPDKIKTNINPNPGTSGFDQSFIMLPYSDITARTGEYILEDSSGNKSLFSLNLNSLESDLTKLNKEEILKYLKNNGLQNIVFIENGKDIEQIVRETRSGLELWKFMLLGALIFIAAEILLSRKLEKS